MTYSIVHNGDIYRSCVEYLDPFTDHEEGGLLIGRRVYNEDRSAVTIYVEDFKPVKSSFSSWGISDDSRKEYQLPAESIGYFPDPNESFKIASELFPLNEESSQTIIGFVHNHMMGMPNPSVYDLSKVSRTFGYIMAIYSNRTKQLKIWTVIGDKDEKWESNKFGSLAQVELEATYAENSQI